jgi:hypothetical protein
MIAVYREGLLIENLDSANQYFKPPAPLAPLAPPAPPAPPKAERGVVQEIVVSVTVSVAVALITAWLLKKYGGKR